jgi:hypothetical protein
LKEKTFGDALNHHPHNWLLITPKELASRAA